MGGKKPLSSNIVVDLQLPSDAGNKLVSEPLEVEARIDKMEQKMEKIGAEMAANRKTGMEKIAGIEAVLIGIQEQLKILVADKASSSKLEQQRSKSKMVMDQNKMENEQLSDWSPGRSRHNRDSHRTWEAKGRGMRHLTESTHSKFLQQIRLKFPKFSGAEDPGFWLMRAERFFMCHSIAYEDQVTVATFHLEGHAQIWYQILWEEEGELTWDQFRDRILVRFGPSAFDDYIGELIKL